MFDARTVKVLSILLVAMTAGALLLMALESAPPHLKPDDLAILSGQSSPSQWTITRSWRRVVVHSAMAESTLSRRCHFVIDMDGQQAVVKATPLWNKQEPGAHIFVPGQDYNIDSVGICLMGDFSKRSPSKAQFETLMALVRTLQGRCKISADRVYLHNELVPSSNMKAFPVDLFNANLENIH